MADLYFDYLTSFCIGYKKLVIFSVRQSVFIQGLAKPEKFQSLLVVWAL